jgi:hypothetical protein
MDAVERERRYLQRAVAIAGCVPVAAGLFGAIFGAALTGDGPLSVTGDSHYRYLSGLLLGLGLVGWSCVPGILTFVVVVGGLARLAGLALYGLPALTMILALGMELIVTPTLCLWQARVAAQHRGERPDRLPT